MQEASRPRGTGFGKVSQALGEKTMVSCKCQNYIDKNGDEDVDDDDGDDNDAEDGDND